MNDSLAKQLQNLINSYKITTAEVVKDEFDNLKRDVKKLIEENKDIPKKDTQNDKV